MKIAHTLLLACGLLAAACGAGHPASPTPYPAWLASLIRELEAQPVANPPASIAKYQYRGEAVYFLGARCCDVWSTVYRADGSVLCHPDGGVGGHGDGLCPTFLAERTNEQIVWRDPRGSQ